MKFDFFTPSWITLKCRAKKKAKDNAYHTTLIITRGPTLLCELGSLFIANTLLLNCAYYKKSIFYHSLTLQVCGFNRKKSQFTPRSHNRGDPYTNQLRPPLPSPSLSLSILIFCPSISSFLSFSTSFSLSPLFLSASRGGGGGKLASKKIVS